MGPLEFFIKVHGLIVLYNEYTCNDASFLHKLIATMTINFCNNDCLQKASPQQRSDN